VFDQQAAKQHEPQPLAGTANLAVEETYSITQRIATYVQLNLLKLLINRRVVTNSIRMDLVNKHLLALIEC